ncbi:putative major facilitator superfamily transporter [Gordonia aichiensis NBRC 108223]|uniref:Putative major facilitator superfamily transporter n=2 Tax=Gordonia aichiensis TaxID=36820 RepID=L7KGC1_9ACTN|nr:putative major facilitator superfamily transporter [Gordonia aichiensis NBRC 108223]
MYILPLMCSVHYSVSMRESSEAPEGHHLIHPAWRMTVIAAAALVAAGSYTTIAGLITDPLVTSCGWSRAEIGIAGSVNMVLYGAIAPFSAALMDRYGLRLIAAGALTLLTLSSVLLVTFTPTAVWFTLWWGILVGTGTGSITMVFGATVANRWFIDRIGLATGILTAASVVGQFAVLPVLSTLMTHHGWHAPVITCGALAVVAALLVTIGLRNQPADLGVTRYGDIPTATTRFTEGTENALRRSLRVLLACVRNRAFWLLSAMFLLCGATTNGLMWSHFTPAVHDHGMAPTAASSLLALIGFANIAGTISAGWLTDRIEPRALLAVFFLIRATALAILPTIFTSEIDAGLIAFAVAFGILDVATVPPTIALCRHYFGADSALAFGWVNVFHQLGAGTMAAVGGVIREVDGTYTPVWIVGATLCTAAAVLGAITTKIHIRHHPVDTNPCRWYSRMWLPARHVGPVAVHLVPLLLGRVLGGVGSTARALLYRRDQGCSDE